MKEGRVSTVEIEIEKGVAKKKIVSWRVNSDNVVMRMKGSEETL